MAARQRARPTLLLWVSDLHAGSTVALCPPKVELDDGGSYTPSRGQRWLWQNWQDFTARAKRLARGHHVVVISGGDIIDGDHHGTPQLVTKIEAKQREMAAELLDPLAQLADRLFFLRGTEVHVGSSEEELGRDFGAEKSFDGTYSWYHLAAEFAGVFVDAAHHPPSGSSRYWSQDTPASVLASTTLIDYAGERAPDLVLRGHNHIVSESRLRHVRAIIGPAWQLKTGFMHKKPRRRLSDIGGIICPIVAGQAHPEIVVYAPERTVLWRDTNKRQK